MRRNALLVGTLILVFAAAAVFAQANIFFGKASPGPEPVKFLPDTLHQGLCPHGQLAFAPDGSGVFWSAIALEGRQQTIYWSAFDGKAFSPFATLSSDGKHLFFIRAFGQEFVGDQAHFYWVETKDIPELSIKQPSPERPKLSEKLSVLLPFIGATWRGSIPGDSRMGEITLKGEVLLNGFAVKFERVVLNANHRLETIYCWDESAGKIAFLAVSNNGFVTKGHVFGRGEEIICEGVQQGNDVNRMVRKIFRLDTEKKLNEEDQFRNEQTGEWRRIHVSVYEAK